MPTLSNYPVSRPVLNLDFANTRVLDPRFTFTRASAGMRFNEQGILVSVADNVPRFEHDPLTGESRGLRIEAASTNLLTYSEDFSNAIWSKANLRGTLNALAAVAPDGATTATQYVENTDASVGRYLSPSQPFTSGTTYTFSIYAKAGTSGAVRYLGLVLPLAAFTAHQVASYDLSGNGTATVSAGTATATIKHVSRGWYRCTLTATATATTTGGLQIRITNSSTNGAASYTGDGASHIYIWGAQLEAQPRHTSYIKTTSATVTRAADYAEMTGSAFTSWFRADEGTVVVKAASLNGGTTISDPVAVLSDGTVNNRIGITLGSTNAVRGRVTVSSSDTVNSSAGTRDQEIHSAALAYRVDDSALAVDGTTGTADTSCTLPTGINRLVIGTEGGASVIGSRVIHRIAYYPYRLSATELAAITQ